VLWALLGLAASVFLLAGSINLAISLGAMLLFGFSQETRRTGTVSLMQSSVDDSQRGRVLSSMFLFTQVAGGLGTMLIGISAAGAGLRLPLIIAVMMLTVVWAVTFSRRKEIIQSFVPKTG
jgi:hypothetical protein